MHILFLSDNFFPEVNAPASRTYEHCREWVKSGHRVTVVTCVPNFPHGKIFQGYQNKIWQVEDIDGIKVIRVWSYVTANEGFVKRILDYMSFMVSASVASLFVRRSDLIIGTSPQFFTVCAAFLVSRFKRIPFVFELRDLWPDSINAVGAMKNKVAIALLTKIEMFLYRKADRIISVTNSFKRTLVERGIDVRKICVVTNGVDISKYQPMPKDFQLLERYDLEGKFVVGYIGTHGLAHCLETILEAAYKARQHEQGKNIRFLFIGDGARKKVLQKKAVAMNLDNVTFIDTVSKGEVASYWSLLDVSVIHLRKSPLFEKVIPSKLFEIMGMGIPVLHGVAGESAKIVDDEGVGLLFQPENSDDLLEKLLFVKKERGAYLRLRKNCLDSAKRFDRAELAGQMLRKLESVSRNHEHARIG